MLRSTALLGLLVAAAAATTAPTPPYPACVPLPGFDLQHARVFGDINNDGVVDIVQFDVAFLQWLPGVLSVQRDPSSVSAPYTLGEAVVIQNSFVNYIGDVALSDMDNDGWPDLLVATTPQTANALQQLPDTSSVNGQTVVAGIFLYMNEAGSFASPVTVFDNSALTQDTGFMTLATADVDADGLTDVLYLSSGPAITLGWLRNSGPGGSWTATPLLTFGDSGYYAVNLQAVDLYGDGQIGALVATADRLMYVPYISTVVSNSGTFTYIESGTSSPIVPDYSVIAVDLDGDGFVELTRAPVTFGEGAVPIGSDMNIYSRADPLNNPDNWSLWTPTQLPTLVDYNTPSGCVSVEAADYDGDGRLDLLCVTWILGYYFGGDVANVLWLWNDPSGGFVLQDTTQVATVDYIPFETSLVDLDRDGLLDVLVSGFIGNEFASQDQSFVSVCMNTATPALRDDGLTQFLTSFPLAGSPNVFVADRAVQIDDSGVDQVLLVAVSGTSYDFAVYPSDNVRLFQAPLTQPQAPLDAKALYTQSVLRPLAADVDADGESDLLLVSGFVSNVYDAAYNSVPAINAWPGGAMGWPAFAGLLAVSTNTSAPLDVVLVDDFSSNQSTTVWVLCSGAATRIVLSSGVHSPIRVADLDNDGFLDVLALDTQQDPAALLFIRNTGRCNFASPKTVLTASSWVNLASSFDVVDIDLDGYLDVVGATGTFSQTSTPPANKQVFWFRNQALGHQGPVIASDPTPIMVCPASATGNAAVVTDFRAADFDGDGWNDLLVSCGSLCCDGACACNDYSVYLVKSLGGGSFNTPKLATTGSCSGGVNLIAGQITLGLFQKPLPSAVMLACGYDGSNNANNPSLETLTNRAIQLTVQVEASNSPQVLSTSTTGPASAAQVVDSIRRACMSSQGSLVSVQFVDNNALPFALPLPISIDSLPTLSVCSVAFAAGTAPSLPISADAAAALLQWQCAPSSAATCLTINNIPVGRSWSWAGLWLAPLNSRVLSTSFSHGALSLRQSLLTGPVQAANADRLTMEDVLVTPMQPAAPFSAPAVTMSSSTLMMARTTIVNVTCPAGCAVNGRNSRFTAFDSTFSGDVGVTAGAVSLSDTSTWILRSTFSGNRAGVSGGAVVVDSSSSAPAPTILFTVFSSNTAAVYGGAVFLKSATSAQPDFFGSTFIDNDADTGFAKAIFYADDSAHPFTTSTFADNASVGTKFTQFNLSSTADLQNMVSGVAVPVTVQLQDASGNTFSSPYDTLVSSTATCSLQLLNSTSNANYSIAVSGGLTLAKNNVCNFPAFTITALPGSKLVFLLSASLYTSLPNPAPQLITLTMASCGPGSQIVSDSACAPCSSGSANAVANSFACSVCQAGTFANAAATACERCPPASIAATAALVACVPCGSGKLSNDSIHCFTCPAGSVPNDAGNDCALCPVGTAAALPGQSRCQACADGYTLVEGSTSCTACQAGLVCDSVTGRALAAAGYWVLADNGTIQIHKCPSDWCTGGTVDDQTGQVLSVNGCKAHHLNTSALCGQCDEASGYHMWDGDCRYCDESTPAGALAIVYIIMFAYTFYQLYFAKGEAQTHLISTLIFFVQTLGIVSGSYSTVYSTSVLSVSWLSWFNLEATFGQCPGSLVAVSPIPAFYTLFWLKLVQPVIMLLMLGFLVLVSLIFTCGQRRGYETQLALKAWCKEHHLGFIGNSLDVASYRSRTLKATIAILLYCYLPVVKTLVSVFNTVPNPDGTDRILVSDPSVHTSDPLYTAHLIVAAVLCALFLPLPFIVFALAQRQTAADSKLTSRFISKAAAADTDTANQLHIVVFGSVNRPFHPSLRIFWLFLELRKVVVLTLVVFLGSLFVDTQDTALAIIFAVMAVLLDWARPFRNELSHFFEMLAMVMLVVAVQSRNPLQDGVYFVWSAVVGYLIIAAMRFIMNKFAK